MPASAGPGCHAGAWTVSACLQELALLGVLAWVSALRAAAAAAAGGVAV